MKLRALSRLRWCWDIYLSVAQRMFKVSFRRLERLTASSYWQCPRQCASWPTSVPVYRDDRQCDGDYTLLASLLPSFLPSLLSSYGQSTFIQRPFTYEENFIRIHSTWNAFLFQFCRKFGTQSPFLYCVESAITEFQMGFLLYVVCIHEYTSYFSN